MLPGLAGLAGSSQGQGSKLGVALFATPAVNVSAVPTKLENCGAPCGRRYYHPSSKPYAVKPVSSHMLLCQLVAAGIQVPATGKLFSLA